VPDTDCHIDGLERSTGNHRSGLVYNRAVDAATEGLANN
jgi:hypothetical protein